MEMKLLKKTILTMAAALTLVMAIACTSYDEEPLLVRVTVRLVYPQASPIGPYKGARVELTNANNSTFVDSTDASGVAVFNVPGGLYNAVSSQVYLDTVSTPRYRYIFNGRTDNRVVSLDSASNNIEVNLTMSRKRIWN